ncbi:AAA family ATPase [Mycobacterium sp. ITM-2016-00316]|uniref:AAA family ATPase n=1 Tax=Mycobacterium sp. ITM-2016-00316 TaxID=2099695 RepID=UPI000CF9F167|nr:ATP-binding protein [Mycobacterium sp. ITM-2016-00316]WNG80636.1 AAA family ATPase [Mycobacterium sp. ITM-2016-00316]
MKLHRLVLTNYRGVAHREIEFPDRGVVVISGANEIGKSSMIEALDLLLTIKDRSTKKEVKAVKPTHADVGAEVIAEISTGPYRFVYRKRFHKRAETELTILAPTRAQLTGDEAHDRVLAILSETMDTALWEAQRVLQASATAPVDLSGCDALSRALDVAAGSSGDGAADADPLLVDRIEVEYLTYFTPTGRPTGAWAAATQRLRAADEEVARAAAAVTEVEQAVLRHGTLTTQLAASAAQVEAAQARATAAQQAAAAVARLTRERDTARVLADAATATQAAELAAVNERRRLRAAIDDRSKSAADLIAIAAESARAHAAAQQAKEAAAVTAEQACAAADTAATAVDDARGALAALVARDEAERLTVQLGKIDRAAGELAEVDRELVGNTMTDALMAEIDTAVRSVQRAADQAELASARIELVALGDVRLRVGDESVDLAAGQDWSASVGTPTDIELPGLVRARVVPGADALDTHATLVAAEEVLAEALRRAGAQTVDEARDRHARRRELRSAQSRLHATIAALTGDETPEQLRARHAELTAGQPDITGDTETARAALTAALTAHRAASENADAQRALAAAAVTACHDAAVTAGVLREKLGTAQAELQAANARLAADRHAATDDQLSLAAEAAAEQAARVGAEVTRLDTELAATQPETVAAELDAATRSLQALLRERDTAATAITELSATLKLYGTQGRKGTLDDAHTEREHAHGEYLRIERRARAAQTLRTVMLRHRESARQRYVEPFRGEIERLGRIVFGADFEVDIGTDLTIRSRTLGGRTVGYESLSGGAKEQIGIVARLACASLVAKEDTVPVVIDDALGFTDPDRLTRMSAVFDSVGGDGQVIVLTCSPDRYAGIGDARLIELTA